MQSILQRYHQVQDAISKAAQSVNRNTGEIKLVVVTKTHPIEMIHQLIDAGVRDFGENRVEEARQKIDALKEVTDLRWHMIGHIQSRKAKLIGTDFNLIHSVDRIKLAHLFDEPAREAGSIQRILLEFNVSGEQTKSGWAASQPEAWDGLLTEVEAVLQCESLEVHGLMTIAPLSPNPEDARTSFVRLRKLRDFLNAHFPDQDWSELSMGMSDDFQVAIQEGATIIRIGTAILGPRETQEGVSFTS